MRLWRAQMVDQLKLSDTNWCKQQIEALEARLNDAKEKLRVVGQALQEASEHLDWVGYGDRYERECAKESKLEEKIENALKLID